MVTAGRPVSPRLRPGSGHRYHHRLRDDMPVASRTGCPL